MGLFRNGGILSILQKNDIQYRGKLMMHPRILVPLVLEKASPGKKQQILRCPQGKFESVWQHISPCYGWKSIQPNQGYVCNMIMFNPTKVVFNMSKFNILSRYQSFCQYSESQNTMLCRAVWSHFAGALWFVAVCELLNHHAVLQNRAQSSN